MSYDNMTLKAYPQRRFYCQSSSKPVKNCAFSSSLHVSKVTKRVTHTSLHRRVLFCNSNVTRAQSDYTKLNTMSLTAATEAMNALKLYPKTNSLTHTHSRSRKSTSGAVQKVIFTQVRHRNSATFGEKSRIFRTNSAGAVLKRNWHITATSAEANETKQSLLKLPKSGNTHADTQQAPEVCVQQ